jgi:hypothetical protein
VKELFARKVAWARDPDPRFPLRAEVDGRPWRIRVNDWPDYPAVYSLVASDGKSLDFDEWPKAWTRPDVPEPRPGPRPK